ncbi:MAG TPA: ABC transporter ATP-binding protein/permease [Candidatus Scubalenecus merdavium]|uniref:ABC transporter ATP-binding protein/permease n=1 Tax=Candidatus Scybalenecus merdavium TaxID=2840939 RepID=A0A9D1MVK9_9FIRM|nr:ABC transporter ATP-binding protein/permease [Candidatus Scubalenecus merdavium]
MIKTNLINQVSQSKKYIALTVLAQWVKLVANVVMMFCIANMIGRLASGERPQIRAVLLLAGAGICVLLVRYFCSMAAARTSFLASAEVKKVLRGKLYNKLTRLGASYHEKVSTSEIVQVFVEGVDQLELYFGKYLPQFFYSVLAPVTLFAILVFVSWQAAVVLLVCVPLIPLSIVAVQKIAKRLLSKYWGVYVDLGDTFLENIQGLTTLKIYQADERRNVQMNEKAEEFRRITMKVLTMQLNSVTVMDIIAYGGAAIGVIISVSQVAAGTISLAQAFLIIMLAADFFLPLRMLGSFFHVAMNGMAASDKLFRILEMDEPEQGTKTIPAGSSAVAFRDVSFSYDQKRPILQNVDVQIPSGAFAAVVGKSGCGKSTMASLLSGLVKGYTGSITVGGVPVREISEENLMQSITVVTHNSYIFSGTVRENLQMAAPDASEERMVSALKQVRLWPFLEEQQGLETVLSEQGANFSGGQRQRLALARAILHDTPIYIFDEATSNIDAESENDIMQVIRSMRGKKTVLLISHRLENVVCADEIYVLSSGKIVQRGTHSVLMQEQGPYAEMYNTQFSLEKFGERSDAQ